MFKNVVPVNKARHAKTRIKEAIGFDFAANFHIAYVTVQEFARASAIYPVVFIEDKTQDVFRPVVLMGLDAEENLFVGKDGKWQASYIPAIIRRYPFALTKASDPDNYVVCIDEGSTLVSETEGSPLFDEKGEPTQIVENVKRYLAELHQMDVSTQEFCKFLSQHNLLTPLNMRVRQSDMVKSISGCYVINEERLNNLSNELFLEIRSRSYTPAIYAQLISLAQIERLVMLKDERTADTAEKPAKGKK